MWLTAETGRTLAIGVEGCKAETGSVQFDLWEARGELGLTWRPLPTPFVWRHFFENEPPGTKLYIKTRRTIDTNAP